jgi:hypothetical protein
VCCVKGIEKWEEMSEPVPRPIPKNFSPPRVSLQCVALQRLRARLRLANHAFRRCKRRPCRLNCLGVAPPLPLHARVLQHSSRRTLAGIKPTQAYCSQGGSRSARLGRERTITEQSCLPDGTTHTIHLPLSVATHLSLSLKLWSSRSGQLLAHQQHISNSIINRH